MRCVIKVLILIDWIYVTLRYDVDMSAHFYVVEKNKVTYHFMGYAKEFDYKLIKTIILKIKTISF